MRRHRKEGEIVASLLPVSTDTDPVRRTSDVSLSSTDSNSSTYSGSSSGSSGSRKSSLSLFSWHWICGADSYKTAHVCCANGDIGGLRETLGKRKSKTSRTDLANALDGQKMLPLDYVLSFARENRTKEGVAIEMAAVLFENGATIPSKLPAQARDLGLYLLAEDLNRKISSLDFLVARTLRV